MRESQVPRAPPPAPPRLSLVARAPLAEGGALSLCPSEAAEVPSSGLLQGDCFSWKVWPYIEDIDDAMI